MGGSHSHRHKAPEGPPLADGTLDSEALMNSWPEESEMKAFSVSKGAHFREQIHKLHLASQYRTHPSYAERWEIIYKFKLYQHCVSNHKFYLQAIKLDGMFNRPPYTDDSDFNTFCDVVLRSRVLEKLSLQRNSLSEKDMQALARVLLSDQTHIVHLNLNDNQLHGPMITHLAGALAASRSLKFLLLEKNNIDDAGAIELANAIRKNASLFTLCLDYNRIETPGMRALCHAIVRNYSLRDFYVGWNRIDEEGAQCARECLLNSAIDKLQISGNPCGFDVLKKICWEVHNKKSYILWKRLRGYFIFFALRQFPELPQDVIGVIFSFLRTKIIESNASLSGYTF